MDFENYLPEDILVKVDRASMLVSLETRAPFLDFRICEFAFGKVPSRLKASSTERKILLKRLCARSFHRNLTPTENRGFRSHCRRGSSPDHGGISSPTCCWTPGA